MKRWLFLALLFLSGAFLLYLPIKTPLNIYDEGLALVNAMRVGRGEIPFRDYWAIYPPGQSYALAALFKWVGPTILAERAYDSLVRLLCALVIYLMAAHMLRAWGWSVLLYGTVIGLLAAATFYGYAIFPALLFAFLALLLFFYYLDQQRQQLLLVTGLSIGVTSLYRVDVAGYVGIAIVLGLLVDELANNAKGEDSSRRIGAFIRHVLRVVTGALVIFLPFYGYLAWVGHAGELFNNLLIFPTTTFHEVRHLPYPTLLPDWSRWQERGEWLAQIDWVLGEWLRFYLPLLIYSVVALILLTSLAPFMTTQRKTDQSDIQAVTLLVLGLGLFGQAMSRYDAIHALPTTLPAILLIGWLWRRLVTARWWRAFLTPLPALLTLIPLFVYSYLPYAQLSKLTAYFPPGRCYSTLPRASCIPIIGEQAALIEELNSLDQRQGALYVGVPTHDRIFINDVSFYFLADRPIATRYHELHPGVATTLPVQEEIAQALEDQQTPWVVIADFGNPREPNGSALSSGVTHLDEYLRSHYTLHKQFGNYQLWQRQKQP